MRGRLPDDPAELTNLFAETIITQHEATLRGDVELARACGEMYASIASKLVGLGGEAKEQFATLFAHPDRIIRVATAVYLFHCLPDRTLAALREIAEGDDFAAFCARLRIKEWEEHPEHYDPSNWR